MVHTNFRLDSTYIFFLGRNLFISLLRYVTCVFLVRFTGIINIKGLRTGVLSTYEQVKN